MKAKLIKTEEGFDLCIPHETTNEFIASTDGMYMEHKLSLKNCKAIERGYNLDELVRNYLTIFAPRASDPDREFVRMGMEEGFKEGFQKALEILSDKKFTEQDVLKVVAHVLNKLVLVEGFDKQFLFPESIYQETTTKCKSLQQTEWDVEIVMEETDIQLSPNATSIEDSDYVATTKKPKLDEDGCIILKKLDEKLPRN